MDFKYTAYKSNGAITKGIVNAQDKGSAAKLVKDQDLILVDLIEQKKLNLNPLSFFSRKASIKDKIVFTKELAIMIKSGLPLVEALKSLAQETDKKNFQKTITAISEDIEGGNSLSSSIAKQPDVFPPIYSSVIRSGEKSGKLDNVLINLAEQMEKDAQLISRVKGALTYPALIFSTLLLVGALIMIIVIPQLEKVFKDVGVSLPLPTRVLLGISHVMSNYWWIVLIALVVIIVGSIKFLKTNVGIRLFDAFKLKVPIFNRLFVKIYSARFARTSYTLISSGVPINEIFAIVGQVINNHWYSKAMDEICQEVKAGKPLSSSIEKTHKFPHLVSSLIKVGEQSGKIDYVLSTIAEYYENEIDQDTSRLTTLIEPIVMLILGTGVGFVVLSVLMPIYQLVNAL